MSNDLISRETLKNLLLDSKPNETQYDINFLTGDIKVSLKFVLKIIDNAPTVKPCDNCDLYFKAMSKTESLDYQRAVEDAEYCEQYEPTYNPNDGSM